MKTAQQSAVVQLPIRAPRRTASSGLLRQRWHGGQCRAGPAGPVHQRIIAGIQYDVGFDMVFGASYIHRDLGRVIEDVSTDGAAYFLANPGEPADPNRINDLQRDLDAAAALRWLIR